MYSHRASALFGLAALACSNDPSGGLDGMAQPGGPDSIVESLPATGQVAPPNSLQLSSSPLWRGFPATFTVSAAPPNQQVRLYGTGAQGAPDACPAFLNGVCLDIGRVRWLGQELADSDGDTTITVNVPANVAVSRVALQVGSATAGAGHTSNVVLAEFIDPWSSDLDGDGIVDGNELQFGTDPQLVDTDGDGLSDADEVMIHNTDPTLADTDGDMLDDGDEINVWGTDPFDSDSDRDLLLDGNEIALGLDPRNHDTDGDNLIDGAELFHHGTDPALADTDGGGLTDDLELHFGTDPNDVADDGPYCCTEDTDGDGILDCHEVEICDGLDNDNDGEIDEGLVGCTGDIEICDGADNDGDGLVDEGFDTDGDGTADCLETEDCDGIDNDGDGLVDEGYTDSDGNGTADCVEVELCDGVDNDGNGLVDDGLASCPTANDEPCDCMDNDGDGLVDEGCSYTLEFLATADDQYEAFLDSAPFGADLGWAASDLWSGQVTAGTHHLAVHAQDVGGVAAGFRAAVYVDGNPISVTGDGSWLASTTNPGAAFNDPLSYTAAANEVNFQWPAPAELDATGARWVWLENGLLEHIYPENWFLLEFEVCGETGSSPEVCNGIDDDGDGITDEGFADQDGDGQADCVDTEICDGVDNDGDGITDEGWLDSDYDGLADCVDIEECDGFDNNGDGMRDEGFPDGDSDGVADCVDMPEICDGIDNDGNGQIDEGFDLDGDGLPDCFDLCGNGVVDLGERCDDGNDDATDGCTNDCRVEVCPDGQAITLVGDQQTYSVNVIDFSTEPPSFVELFTGVGDLQGVDYNPIDGHIYGTERRAPRRVWRMYNDGTRRLLGTLDIDGNTLNSGGFMPDGRYVVATTSVSNDDFIAVYDVSTEPPTQLNTGKITWSDGSNAPLAFGDLAPVPGENAVYAANAAANGQLLRIDLDTLAATNVGQLPPDVGQTYFGSMFTDSGGRLFVYGGFGDGDNAQSDLIQYDLSTGLWSVLTSGGPTGAATDGGFCVSTRGGDGVVSVTGPTDPGDAILITVADPDLDFATTAAETVSVQVFNDVTGEVEFVTLTETGPSTGVFTGSLDTTLGASPDADGELGGGANQTYTITYEDFLTSTGNGPEDVTATGSFTAGPFGDDAVVDAAAVLLGEPVVVTVTDGDVNDDPTTPETLTVTVTSSDGDTETLVLTETGPDTGVFTASLPTSDTPSSADDGTLTGGPGDEITVSYTDAVNTAGPIPAVLTDTTTIADLLGTDAIVAVTDETTLGEPLTITITDPDANADRGAPDTRTATVSNADADDIETVLLTETGPDTGVFTATLPTSSGLATQEDGTISGTAGDTYVAAHTDGLHSGGTTPLVVDDQGSFIDPTGSDAVVVIAPLTVGDPLVVSVEDDDENGDPTVADVLTVTLTSSNGDAETLVLTETGPDTGVFTASLPTSPAASAVDDGTLTGGPGDEVTVTYVDALNSTGPNPMATTDTTTIADQTGVTGVVEVAADTTLGEPLTVTVTDDDMNSDPTLPDTLDVQVVNNDTGEVETLTLTETGPDTGVFTATLPTLLGVSPDEDGALGGDDDHTYTASWTDPLHAGGTTPLPLDDSGTFAVPTGATGTLVVSTPVVLGDGITLTLTDADLSAPSVDVVLTNDTTGESETVTLLPLGDDYVATVPTTLAASSDDDGTLAGSDGDGFTATYVDDLTADGPGPTDIAATGVLAVPTGTDATISVSTPTPLGDPLLITVVDPDEDTPAIDTVLVVVTNDTTGESETITLTETGPTTGVFTASVPTSPGVSGDEDGTLGAADGETYTATYSDALTSTGPSPTDVVDSGIFAEPTGVDGVAEITISAVPGAALTLTVTDADLDLTASADSVDVVVTNDTTGERETVTLTETGPATGAFTANLPTISGASPDEDGTLGGDTDDAYTLTYSDTLHTAGSTPIDVTATGAFTADLGSDAVLTVDASTITGDTMLVTVIDPDANTRAGVNDTVVVVLTNDATGESETITLVENFLNTGIFTANVPTTFGASPDDDGTLGGESGHGYTVTYTDAANTSGSPFDLDESGTFSVPVGETGMVAIEDPGSPGTPLTLTVTDNDLNPRRFQLDSATVTVTNDITGESETVTLTETENNSGIFTAELPTTQGASVDEDGTLGGSEGDTYTVTYTDDLTAAGPGPSDVTDTGTFGLPAGTDGSVAFAAPVAPGSAITILVTDPDLVGTVDVVVTNDVTGESETVTLTETDPGVLTGTLPTVEGASGDEDGTLGGNVGDAYTVTYTDASTAAGGAADTTDTDTFLPTSGETGLIEITDPTITGESLTITLTDNDVNTRGGVRDTIDVTLTNDTTGETETITLTETFLNTGVFMANVDTTNGASADEDGTLGGDGGDTYTVAYTDDLTASGPGPSVSTASGTFTVPTGDDGTVLVSSPTAPGLPITVTVTDDDLNTRQFQPDSATVILVNDATGETETLTLTETGNNTGIFEFDVPTTATSGDEDGTLGGSTGDTYTATYTDDLTSTGPGPADVSANGLFDASGVSGTTGIVEVTDAGVGADLTVTVTDADLNTRQFNVDTATVILVNDITGESETLTLTETGNNTGVFELTLPTTAGPSANDDGTLGGSEDDTYTATYTDALTAAGPGPSDATDTGIFGAEVGNDGTVEFASPVLAGFPMTITVTDPDLNADGTVETVDVTVTNDATGEVETVTLTETGPISGVFTADLPTVSGASTDEDGTLGGDVGDAYTASYDDTSTASGAPATRTDTDVFLNDTGVSGTIEVSDPTITGEDIVITVTDADLNIRGGVRDTVDVTVTNDATGETETLTLTETFLGTGIFTANLPSVTGASPDEDGALGGGLTETYTATYDDVLTANGPGPVSVTDTGSFEVPSGVDGTIAVTAEISPGGAITVTVNDEDLKDRRFQRDTVDVTIVNDRTGESETVTLLETENDSGIFEADVPTGSGSPNAGDGVLEGTGGDTYTATYSDALRADGPGPVLVTATGDIAFADEVCDGADNNGDGLVDEGFDVDSDGVADCFDIEECDFVDNDGDGDVDEGFDLDGDGAQDCFGVDPCDGIDNDGDGLVDEGWVDSDGNGIADCVEVETCDGLDNNGDGLIDEGLTDCATTNDEACDCADNDGDGLVDEGCSYQLDVRATADDEYEIYIDDELKGGDLGWRHSHQYASTIEAGSHFIAVHAWDVHKIAAGFRAAVWIDGDLVSATGEGTWWASDVDPGPTWTTDPMAYDHIASVTSFAWTGPGDLNPTGAEWIWHPNGLAEHLYPENWFLYQIDVCGDPERGTETCNGIDDDGDGRIDEGYLDSDGNGIADCIDVEICDGFDNDGDGYVDEGSEDSDFDGIADCIEVEVCDGVDNTGDTLIDNGFPDSDGDGRADCVDLPEVCDGVDNDGNGLIDDGFDNDGDGISNCFDTETCDGIDNDDNGETDEGFVDGDFDGIADCVDIPECGNGYPEAGEGCDDGNLDDLDGCDNSCQIACVPGSFGQVRIDNVSNETVGGHDIPRWDPDSNDPTILRQVRNADPSIWVSSIPAGNGREITFTMGAESFIDDDFIGFAIGYEPNEVNDPNADWILIDWKQGPNGPYWFESIFADPVPGLAISRVNGLVDGPSGWKALAEHNDFITELARGNTLSNTGWVDFQLYEFRVITTPTRIAIWVDDVLEFDLSGNFPTGVFSFYNFSQQGVFYQLLSPTTDLCDPQPETCDGADNDDDGTIDNGMPDADGDGNCDDIDPCPADPLDACPL